MEPHSEQQIELFAAAFRKVLSEGEAGTEENRAILIKRIPIICNDIIEIKEWQEKSALAQEKTSTDMGWIKWLVMGITAGVGALLISLLTKGNVV